MLDKQDTDARSPYAALVTAGDPSSTARYKTYMFTKYDELKVKTLKLMSEGKLPSTPSREQRIDIAYGNATIENDAVTHEMVAEAVDAKRAIALVLDHERADSTLLHCDAEQFVDFGKLVLAKLGAGRE